MRLRLEALDGQFRPGAAASDAILLAQTRIAAEYDLDAVRLGAELWDARGYLQRRSSSAGTGEINALELVQAYAALPIGGALLKAGRVTMDIGSRRLISRQRFRNTTNAFTGLHMRGVQTGADAPRWDAFWVLPQRRLPDDGAGIRADRVTIDRESIDLQLFGGSAEIPLGSGLRGEIYAYGLIEDDHGMVQTADRRLLTPGIRLFRAPKAGRFDVDVELSGQVGRTRASTAASDRDDLVVRAWAAHAEAGYRWRGGWSPRAALFVDAASGDGSGKRFGRFDTLYGARRFELGPTSLYGAVARTNIVSPGVRVDAEPSARIDAFVAWRLLRLAATTDRFAGTGVRDPAGDAGRRAGQQIEGRVRVWLKPDLLRLDTGVALLLKSRFLRDAANAPATGNTRYGYVSLNIEI